MQMALSPAATGAKQISSNRIGDESKSCCAKSGEIGLAISGGHEVKKNQMAMTGDGFTTNRGWNGPAKRQASESGALFTKPLHDVNHQFVAAASPALKLKAWRIQQPLKPTNYETITSHTDDSTRHGSPPRHHVHRPRAGPYRRQHGGIPHGYEHEHVRTAANSNPMYWELVPAAGSGSATATAGIGTGNGNPSRAA